MKEDARHFLMHAKILQFFADILAVLGIFIFAILYFKQWNGEAQLALRDPMFVVAMVIPFIPAACFAYAAQNKKKKLKALLEETKK